VQYRRQIVATRRRAQQQAEAAQRRAAAAEARSEKVDRARSAVKDTVKCTTASAAVVANRLYWRAGSGARLVEVAH